MLRIGGKDQRDRRKHEHRRLRTHPGGVEVLLGVALAPGEHGGTEHQQDIPDYGTRYRRFHDVLEAPHAGQRAQSSPALPKVALRSPPIPSPIRSASCSVARPKFDQKKD